MAKKIALAGLVVVLVIGVAVFWMWRRVTALPDWYGSADMIAEDGSPRVDPDWVRIPNREPDEPEAHQLRNPHLRVPTSRSSVHDGIKASRATYTKKSLEVGAVINLSEVDVDSLPPKDQAGMRDAIDAFPALTGRDVYVGVEGEARERDGVLRLGPDTRLRVGDTSYSLATAAKRLGMSEAELRATLDDELARMEIQAPG